jgi:hypothetical protein
MGHDDVSGLMRGSFQDDVVDQFAGDDNFLFDWTIGSQNRRAFIYHDRDMSASSREVRAISASGASGSSVFRHLPDKPDYHVPRVQPSGGRERNGDFTWVMYPGNSVGSCS